MTAHDHTGPAISVTGLRKSFGGTTVLDGINLAVPEGTIFALLGPNGAGKTTIVQILSTLISADGGQARVAGHDVSAEPDAVRAAIGVTGQFSAVDHLLTGEENMRLMADLHHLGRREGRRRVAALLDRFDLTADARKQAAALLRRHAAPARPRDDPGRRPAADLPGRADHRPRSAQPPDHVADHPRPGRRRRRRSSSPRSTWRRPISSPAGSRCSTTASSSPRAAPYRAQAPASPAGTIRLHFANARDLRSRAPRRTVGAAARDDEALTLQVPGDGGIARSLRDAAQSARRRASVEVDRLSVQPRTSMTSSWP